MRDQEDVVKGLRTLKPGFLPIDIFYEICRLTVTAIVDIFPLRWNSRRGCVEVLLLKREKGDKYWSGMYHIPGVVLLSTDKQDTLKDALDRILVNELKGVSIKGEPVFVTYSFKESKRGMELSLVHWAEVISEVGVGKWFCEDRLPKNMIVSQTQITKSVIKDYKSHQ